MSRVCVVGLGKLGAVMAGVFADVGHQVVAVDVNADTVSRVRAGIAPVDEPGLQELLDRNAARLVATGDLGKAVDASDIAFIIVPTPSLLVSGRFDDSYVLEVVREIGAALKYSGAPDYTVVVCSTVMPGSCSDRIQPALDEAAGRHVPLVYSPEFIALGSVVEDLRHPDFVLIGADDLDGVGPFVQALSPVVGEAPFMQLSLVNAELAKLSVNSYVTMKISFANQLADLCEGIPGADVREVLRAIGQDKRIGRAYLNAGGPFAGPCFPRDNRAFQALGAAPLAAATDVVNGSVVDRIVQLVAGKGVTAILGLSYKLGTYWEERSLGSRLSERPGVWARCPMRAGAQKILDEADVAVVAINDPWYRKLDFSALELVVDVWGILDPAPNIVRLGVGPS